MESGRRQQIGGATPHLCFPAAALLLGLSLLTRQSASPTTPPSRVLPQLAGGACSERVQYQSHAAGSCAQAVCVSAKRKAAAADSDACLRGWLLLISPYTVIDRNRRSMA